jgi:uncharacterized membrane protein
MVYNNPWSWETETKDEFDQTDGVRPQVDLKTVVGLFPNSTDARQGYDQLQRAGFPSDDISFVVPEGVVAKEPAGKTREVIAETAGMGAVGGSMLGGFAGLLASTGALVIPGIGPVLAAGTLATTLATTLAGAGLGAVAGGLGGTLIGMGVTQNDAQIYAEGVRQGGVLLVVHTDGIHANQALETMRQAGAIEVEARNETE